MPTPSNRDNSKIEKRNLLIEQLEERALFDAVPIAPVDANSIDFDPNAYLQSVVEAISSDLDQGKSQQEQQQNSEILFVDKSVEGFESLVADFVDGREVDVFFINDHSAGLTQIANHLQDRSNIEAIHIISHGNDGQLNLGNSVVNQQHLSGQYSSELIRIGQSLSDNGDILFYGCDLASTAKGEAFIAEISQLTNADVAASEDLTGAASDGGNWILEKKVGSIEATTLSSSGFEGTLLESDAGFTVGNSPNIGDGEIPIVPLGQAGTSSLLYANAATANSGSITIDLKLTLINTFDENGVQTTGLANQMPVTFGDWASSPVLLARDPALGSLSGYEGHTAEILVEFFDQATGNPLAVVGDFTFHDVDYEPAGGGGSGSEAITILADEMRGYQVSDTPATEIDVIDNGDGTTTFTNDSSSGNANDEQRWVSIQFHETTAHTLIFTARDSHTGYGLSTKNFSVTPQSFTQPEALDDDFATDQNTSISGNVITADNGNGIDNDPDGDTLTVNLVDGLAANVGSPISGTNGGLFTIDSDGAYTFDPNGEFDYLPAGQTASTTITYQISDGTGLADTATVTVIITGTDDVPVNVGSIPDQTDTETIAISGFDVSVYFDAVDSDDSLTFDDGGTLPPGLSLDSTTGVITGTPLNHTHGSYSVTIAASDSENETAFQTFTWTIDNPGPTATDNTADVIKDDVLVDSGNVLTDDDGNGIDNDPDGDSFTVTAVDGSTGNLGNVVAGSYGDVVIASDGSYTYTLDNTNPAVVALASGATLTDSFTYTITDEDGGNSTATLDVTISNPVQWTLTGDASVVEGNLASYLLELDAGVAPGDSVSVDLVLADVDTTSADYADFVAAVNSAISGRSELSFDGTTLTYTAPTGYQITDSPLAGTFDDISGTGTGLNSGDDDSDAVVIGFDFDFYGVTHSNIFIGSNGFVTFGGGSTEYTNQDLTTDTIGNRPAIAAFWDDLNPADGDSDDVYYQLKGAPGSQEFIVQWNQLVPYGGGANEDVTFQLVLSEGSEQFEVRYLDTIANGASDNGASATIGVHDGTSQFEQWSFNTANAITSNTKLTFSAPNSAMTPIAIDLGTTDDTTAEPDEDYRISLSNATGITGLGTDYQVTTTINDNDNSAPTAEDNTSSVVEDTQLTDSGNVISDADGIGVDSDPDGDSLTVNAVTGPLGAGSVGSSTAGNYGSIVINGDGTYTYTLDNNNATVNALDTSETLTEIFTYTVTDGNGATSNTATLTVTINGADDAIVMGGDTTGDVDEDGTLSATGALAPVDVDTSDNPLNFTVVNNDLGDNGYGDFSIDAAGNWDYDLNNAHAAVQALDAGETLSDTYTFTVTNNDGDTETQQVTITITGADDAIVIGGTTTGDVDEDGTLSASGALAPSDVDTTDNPLNFTVVNNDLGDNGYGDFSIDAAGNWDYDLNNSHADVQALDAGETLSDTYTFTVTNNDGDTETQQVTITITGADDAIVIGGTTTGDVDEDGTLSASGALVPSDIDTSDNPLNFTVVNNDLGDNGYGDFSIDAAGNWDYNLNNSHADVQALDAGETLSDTYTFTVTNNDGNTETQEVTITITGADDPIVIGGTIGGDVDEDGTLSASGALVPSDIDTSDNPLNFTVVNNDLGDNGYGDFTIDAAGNWDYDLNNAHAAVQALDAGETLSDTYTFTVTNNDGDTETQQVTITITGADDAIVIGGTTTGDVDEDGTLSASGALVPSDIDTTDNPLNFTVVNDDLGDNGYGDFSIDAAGNWDYDLNNAHAAVQALDAGETLSDTYTFTVTNNDGDTETQQVTITITGADDAIVIGGTTTGDVDEDGALSASGALVPSDIDTSDNPLNFTVVNDAPGDNGYGDFSIDAAGNWDYDLNNAHAAVQALDAGETLSDTYTFTVTNNDGDTETQQVTITITGADDAIVIGGTTTGDVDEDGTLSASGALVPSDIDTTDNPLNFTVVSDAPGDNGYGDFSIDAAGNWDYDLNNAHADVQALDAGETLSDTYTFTVTNNDGDTETQQVTITITGADDAIVIGGTTTGDVDEDGTLSASGALVPSDIDTTDNPLNFTVVNDDLGDNGYGDFSIDAAGNWDYDLNNAHADVQALDAGETLSDTYTFTVTNNDGDTETQQVTITITGADDAIVIGGTIGGDVDEDGTLSASGALVPSDIDTTDNPLNFTVVNDDLGDNGYGDFSIDAAGNWDYDLNNAHAAVQALDAGETLSDTYTFTVTNNDGDTETQQVTITITGADDAIVIGGTTTGDVDEDGTLSASGALAPSDVDTTDNPLNFTVVNDDLGDNGYGDFSIDAAGNWDYDLNNSHVAVQALDAGETLTDTYTFTVTNNDGDTETQQVTITITGADDAIVIGGTTTGDVDEDGTLSASGALVPSDIDTSDNPLNFTVVNDALGDNGYGDFSIDAAGNWNYDLNNSHAAVQALDAGETLSDTYTFTVTNNDGDTETQQVTITITGADDAIVIGGTTTGDVDEDGTLSASGALAPSDVDTTDNPLNFTVVNDAPGDNGYGDFSIDAAGNWDYDLNNAHAAVQALDAGETLSDTYTFTVTNNDGDTETQQVTITITGADDAIVIGGTTTGDVDEDGTLSASGALVPSDIDTSDNPLNFTVVNNDLGDNGYGDFSIDAAGNWDYDLNNAHADVQALDAGETLSDTYTFTVTNNDGDTETQQVTITITGADDAIVIGGTTTGDVDEDGTLSASGALAPSDVDTTDNPLNFTVVSDAPGDNGYGDFSIDAAGNWDYDLNNAHADVQALDAGETLSDTYTFTVTNNDGDTETQQVTITITGADDAIVIGGTTTGDVDEDGTLSASGALAPSDVDTTDNPLNFTVVNDDLGDNGYGDFSIDAAGNWDYDLNNAHADVQALDAGETLSDTYTFTVTNNDGDTETQQVTITITGADDAIVIGGTTTGDVDEDGTLSASGALVPSDIDTTDNPLNFTVVNDAPGDNGYGDFSIDAAGNWDYDLNNAHAAVQALDAGETLSDTYTFTVTNNDGDTETQEVTITITGADDAIVIGGTTTGDVDEDGTLSASGALAPSDIDTTDNPLNFTVVNDAPGDNGYGDFSIDAAGNWDYDLNNAHADVQALDAGETLSDTYTFTVTNNDGDTETQQVTITITGADDAIVIGGTTTGDVDEDGTLSASGALAPSDIDTSDNPLNFTVVDNDLGDNKYGDFSIDTAGNWVYDLDNSNADVQALDAGETLTDTYTFTVTNADGDKETQEVTITITGADDAIVIGGDTTDDVEEDGTLSASGTLEPSDIDTTDAPLNFTEVNNDLGDNGYGNFSIDADGDWDYDLNNSHADVQALDAGETLSDSYTFTVTNADGATETQQVTITITGADDAIVIGGTTTGDVDEDGTLSASGALVPSDIDTTDAPLNFTVVNNALGDDGYGDFSIDAAGNWVYDLNNAHADVQALDAGDTLNDTYTFTVTNADGDTETQEVTITITGADDAIVLGGTTTGDVVEDATFSSSGTITATDTAGGSVTFGIVNNQIGDNGFGDFSIDAAGNWDYDLNNAHADVQALDAGETLSDTYTFTVTNDDGDTETQQVTITITGADDAIVIGGTTTGDVDEDGTLSASGALVPSDIDTSDNPLNFTVVNDAPGDNGYGDFTIDAAGNWDYDLNNAHAAVQALDAGETLSDTYTFTVTNNDGDTETQQVTITITGADDAIVIGGTTGGDVDEDGTLSASGALAPSDIDTSDNPLNFTVVINDLGDNGYGDFSIDAAGNWDYDLNNAHAAVQALDAGETLSDTYTFTVTNNDGDTETQQVTITITGADDAIVIGGTIGGDVDEDGTLSASGALAPSDIDTTDNPLNFTVVNNDLGDNGYGDFSINAAGNWDYDLNNAHAAVQALDAGETLTDTYTFTVTNNDGDTETQQITITITGADDAIVIGGTTTGDVDEDGTLSASGALAPSDIDTTDNPLNFTVVNDAPGDNGYGDFSIDAAGNWDYDLNNAHAAVQALDAGETLSDTYTFTVTNNDGDTETQEVTITITGADDAIVIGGTTTGDVDEDGTLSASGALAPSDIDTTDNPLNFTVVNDDLGDNGYGDFSIDAAGNWDYDLNNAHADVQALDAGETLSDTYTFTVTNNDGDTETQQVTITITGADDAIVIGGTTTGDVDEDGTLSASGALAPSDIDTTDNPLNFTVVNNDLGDNGYGDFSIDAAGNWDYDLNNSHAAVQALDAGETLSDTYTFTVTNNDGDTETQQVTITITGADDAIVIGGTTGGDVEEDGTLSASGVLIPSDIDTTDAPLEFTVVNNAAGDNGYGDFSIDINGNWDYLLDNTNPNVQSLAEGETLVDTFTFTVTNADGTTETQQVTVTITGTNDSPTEAGTIPNQNSFDADLITSLDVSPFFSDSDLTDSLTYSASGLPGGLSIDPVSGEITGTIDKSASQFSSGSYTVTITADDEKGGSADQTFVWNVANPAPVAHDNTASVTHVANESVTGNVILDDNGLGADIDPDDDSMSVIAVDGASVVGVSHNGTYGAIIVNSLGQYTYTLDGSNADVAALGPADSLTETFSYTISDGEGGLSSASLSITINGANLDPVVGSTIPPQANLDGESIAAFDVSTYFSDPEGMTLVFAAADLPSGLSISADGEITGTLTSSASQDVPGGAFSVTITATDPFGASVSTTFDWTITNPTPIAQDDSFTIDEDSVLSDTVIANDSDPDNDTVTYTQLTNASNGTAVLDSFGNFTYTPDADFFGTDSFDYEIEDADGAKSTATVHITVDPVNDAPTVSNPTLDQVSEDADLINFNVAGNFDDIEADTLMFSAIGLPPGLSIDPSGNITGTIAKDASQFGPYFVTIQVNDGNGGVVTDDFTWTVSNPAPTANNNSNSIAEDGSIVNGNVILNDDGDGVDSDPDGDDLEVSAVDGQPTDVGVAINGTYGTIQIDGDGSYTYSLDSSLPAVQNLDDGEILTESFGYTITDNEGGFASAVLSITINGQNDAPVVDSAIPNQSNQDADSPSLLVAPFFADVEGDVLTFAATGLPTGLTIDLNSGEISGTIDGSASTGGPSSDGVYPVSVTATDDSGESVTAIFNWTITNPVPIAQDDSFTMDEDTSLSDSVAGNDSDADNDGVTYSLTVGPTNGDLTFNADGSFTYIPDPNFHGNETFEYDLCDDDGACASATVTITVDNVNDDPTVSTLPAQDNLDQDTVSLDLTAWVDDLDGDTLTYTITGLPPGLVATNGVITGTIDSSASQTGPYTVNVSVADGNGGTASGTFEWTVTNPGPIASNDNFTTPEDTTFSDTVGTNDSDPDGDGLTFTLLSNGPFNGIVSFNPDGSFDYIPDAGFSGYDSFDYEITDGDGDTATATVTIGVGAVNDPPVLDTPTGDQSNLDGEAISIDAGTAFSDSDVGDVLTFSATGLPPGLSIDTTTGIISGTLTVDASQGGPYSVEVTATDLGGLNVSDLFDWEVTNPTPIAGNDSGTTAEDTVFSGNANTNDFDPDGDALTFSLLTPPANGSVVMLPNGEFTYTPTTDFNGIDTFTYTITDGDGATGTATVTINVTPVNDAPTAVDDTTFTSEDSPVVVKWETNDTDPDNDPLSVSVITKAPTNGTVVINPDGSVTYTPNANFAGTDSFEYEACDPAGECDTATVTIIVTPVNDAPVAGDDLFKTEEDTPLMGTVVANDVDPDGDALTYSLISPPASGMFAFNPDGTFTFVPDADYVGTVSFEYQIMDPAGATSSATATIVVTPVNDAPVAVDDSETTDEDNSVVVRLLDNDSDSDIGDSIKVTEINGVSVTIGEPIVLASGAIAIVNSDGTASYDPNGQFEDLLSGQSAFDTFHYTIVDENGLSSSAEAVIMINGENDVPIAEDDFVSTPMNTPVVFDVTGNDMDPEGKPLAVVLLNQPNGGTAVVNPDGTILFTPDQDFEGTTTMHYLIEDSNGATCDATVTLDVVAQFQFDSFTNFSESNFARGLDHLDAGNRPILTQEIFTLAPEPIFSGYANPGTQIVGRIYDASGALVGEASANTDPGGNWMMQFHDAQGHDFYRIEFETVSTGAADVYGYLGIHPGDNSYQSMSPMTAYDRPLSVEGAMQTSKDALEDSSRHNSRPLGLDP